MSLTYTDEYQGFLIKPYKEVPFHYAVVTAGKGGKIPNVLSGLYTTKSLAKKAIDTYLLSKPKKETNNGEEDSKG
jgi:hypothetical protein